MDMESDTKIDSSGGAAFQGRGTERKGGVQAIAGGDHPRLRLLPTLFTQRANKAFVLADTIGHHTKAIPVGDLVGETGTNTGPFYRVSDDIQAPLNCTWTGMVIDDAGGTMTNGINHKHFGTGASIFQGE